MSDEIGIYVADLAADNAGGLHGVWIDAAQNPETIREQVRAMLAASPEAGAEEVAIPDYEGFGGYQSSAHAQDALTGLPQVAFHLVGSGQDAGMNRLGQLVEIGEEPRTVHPNCSATEATPPLGTVTIWLVVSSSPASLLPIS